MGTSVVKYSYQPQQNPHWGVLMDAKVHRLDLEFAHHKDLMTFYFEQRGSFNQAIDKNGIAANEVTFHSPLSKDIQMYAQGLNYHSHRDESGVSSSEETQNLVFYKSPSSICGPDDDIVRPAGCELLDYEIELGVVLKQPIQARTHVSEGDLGRYIGGLVLCNDVSARDEQFGASMIQWFKGKSFRTFCPTGPVLYLLDEQEAGQIYKLDLCLKLNGQTRQSASTSELIHKPAKTLSDISEFADLELGDCILTGTPGGVLANNSLRVGLSVLLNMKNDIKRRRKFTQAQKAQQTFMQPGDRLELSIRSADGMIDLGKQTNVIVDA